MAYSDYLTTTCDIHQASEERGTGGAIPGNDYGPVVYNDVPCSQPVPLAPNSGDTLGRDGLIMTHSIYYDGPRKGIGPGWQIRVGSRRFDVDSEIDTVGFGRVVRAICREVQA